MAIYGVTKYGEDTYGASSVPASVDFDIYDFCEPSDATMLSLFAYSEVTASRFGPPNMQFDGNNDLVMLSDDDLDSGFHVDIAIPSTFTIQFSVMPEQLPTDFSDNANHRIFVAGYDRYGKMIGILLSENGGVALAQTGDGAYEQLPDSADLFEESTSDYWVFRITADPDVGRGNLFITRKDLLPIIGHQLRYTFNLLDAPVGITDQTLVEVLGSAGDPTKIRLDCWRLSSSVLLPNSRPIAVPGSDQTLILGGYAGFDGRDSYDPDGDNITRHWWTSRSAPEGSDYLVEGSGDTAADATGFTNVVTGSSGDFSDVKTGDLLYIGDEGSVVKYVGDTEVVVIDHVFPAGVTGATWTLIKQEGWGGAFTTGIVTEVIDIDTTPPGGPSDGDAYLVDNGAGGFWAGQDEKIATWSAAASTWLFTTPSVGDVVYVIADTFNRRYISAAHPGGFWEIDDPLPWELDHWSGRLLEIGSFLPDINGLYTMDLIVRDDGSASGGAPLSSLPTEVLLNVNETAVPFGVIPDLGWIWNYLPDFWDLVADKDKITTVWSGFTQVAAGLMLELWQHDYGKALLDIQRVFQKKWLHYTPEFEEPNYEILPAAVNTEANFAGYSAAPGTNEFSYDTGAAVSSSITGKYILVLDGLGYRIDRVVGNSIITKDALPTTDRPVFWQVRPSVLSRTSNFDTERVGAEDIAVFEIVYDGQNPFEIESYVYGVRRDYLAFDIDPIQPYVDDTDATILFKGVKRRGAYRLNDYIVGIPRLQEVINLQAVEGAPGYLYENLDYFVGEEVVPDSSAAVNTLRHRNSFSPRVGFGFDGESTSPEFFDSASSDFEEIIGDNDPQTYVLEIGDSRYRVKAVTSTTRLELEAEALAPLTGAEWTLRQLTDLPTYLWGEVTYVDNRPTIEANFGRLVNIEIDDINVRTDDLDYLSAVQGLWYTYWFGPTPYNLRIGSQILLGLPFAEVTGTIVDISLNFDTSRSRVLVQDAGNDSIIRSYFFPRDLGIETNPDTGVGYALGDTVEQFAPLSKGIEVDDYVENEDWISAYVTSGDVFEVWKTHVFGITVDATAFDITNLEFVISYILRIKPHYTYPLFVVRSSTDEVITVDDAFAIGPVVPGDAFDLDDGWVYPTPLGWATSPWESRVNRVAYTYDETARWPTSKPTETDRYTEQGNLLLADTPGRVPSGNELTRAEGFHLLNDTDESGNYIHTLNASLAVDIAVDGDMALAGVANWPDIPRLGPGTKQKVTHVADQRLEVSDAGSLVGCYQDFAGSTPADLETWQVAVRCKVYVISGQARFRLKGQDSDVFAETGTVTTPDVAGVTLTDTAATFVTNGVQPGAVVNNTTDGSLAEVIAVISETQLTVTALTGGSDNQWDSGDAYTIWNAVIAESRHVWAGTDVYQDVVLHHWAVSGGANAVRFEILTGPAGGQFYVDDVEFYEKAAPWDQWGLNRMYLGRTGGYTIGGSPDEYVTGLIAGSVL